MLPFGLTDTEFALVTFLSAFLGIIAVVAASGRVKARYLAAFALGIYLWFFTDTLSGANYLGVNGGFTLSGQLAAYLILFVLGLLAFASIDRDAFEMDSVSRGALLVGVIAALSIGLHGMAEGADFGIAAAQTPSNSVFDAFGGLAPSVSWTVHKMLEPAIAAVVYSGLADTKSKNWSDKVVDAVILATVFVIPAVIGSVAGYFVAIDSTYIYAIGLGASVYALVRVARGLYSKEEKGSWLSLKMTLGFLLGFLLIFVAALLHS